MSSSSRSQREQLKQQYKKHYRKMREAKERLRRSQKTRNIAAALKDMDKSELMASFDSFLFEVQSTVAHAEAKLDVALESLETKDVEMAQQGGGNEVSNKTKARETLKQLKNEMGLLYSELERRAEGLDVEKTIGKSVGAKAGEDQAVKEK